MPFFCLTRDGGILGDNSKLRLRSRLLEKFQQRARSIPFVIIQLHLIVIFNTKLTPIINIAHSLC